MANGTIHKLGTLYVNGSKISNPTRPWRIDTAPLGATESGNVYDYNSNSGNIEIRNTDSDDAYKLQWIEVNDNGKKLLICDRNILTRVSWDDLNEQGFVNGKEITIDGQEYKIRLLSGGVEARYSENWNNGASPTDNEWDRIIVNEDNLNGLPIPSNTDLDETLDSSDYSSEHNKVWNWAGMYSWCKEVYSKNSKSRVYRSYNSASHFNADNSGNKKVGNVGWRPVLEENNEKPIISGENEDLGLLFFGFTKEYNISSPINESMTVTERINGEVIRTLENQPSGTNLTLDTSDFWDELEPKEHNIEIEVTTTSNKSSLKVLTFTKAKAKKKKLGTLYVNGNKIKIPKYPWVNGGTSNGAPAKGDIFEYNGVGNIEIRNTDSDDDYKLQWVEVNDKGKKLLICDRNIMTKVSWDSLNEQGFVNGKEITIDGQKCKIRLLSGGSSVRNDEDWYSGGSPTDNEWDRIIVNEGNFEGIPNPSNTDLDSSLNSTDANSPHNKVWNWFYCYSWCKEVYSEDSESRAIRGSYSARYFIINSGDGRYGFVGWRPALEILSSAPTISDSDRDFGDFASPFIKTYTITDFDNNKMKVVEKINGDIIRTLENQTSGTELTIDLTSKWKDLSIGKHTITIEVNDGKGGVATRKWTFTKTNSTPEKPTILYPKNNMRTKEEFYVRFTVGKDAEGDAQEVKIQLADDNKFSSNLKEFAEGLEKNVGGSWISHSGDITDADIGNEFRISVKATKNTTKYIRVATKDKTSGVTEFSDAGEVKIGDELQFETIAQTFDFKPYAISIVDKKEVDSNATIRVYACNNALDTDKTWEDITEEYKLDKPYVFTNKNKENENWAVSVKYEIEANNSTEEISIDAIGIGVS